MQSSLTNDAKIPLPKFLQILTDNNVPVKHAMAVAGKIYKNYSTASKLCELTDFNLVDAGISEKDVRKLVLTAVRKAGYMPAPKTLRGRSESVSSPLSPSTLPGPSSSSSSAITPGKLTSVQILTTPTKRKRKQAPTKNEFLPDGPPDEAEGIGSLDFDEVLDEEILKNKSTTVNRAPLMTAWAMVVAERMGFQREEALSIASVYTEMNALSKGVSIGIFEKGKDEGIEAVRDGFQPYVDFIGRRPLYRSQAGQWRALLRGSPADPASAFSYISRSMRQTTPYIMGALRLLAASAGSPTALNNHAWSLYADFRPEVNGWGGRGQVHCDTILALRRNSSTDMTGSGDPAVNKAEAEMDKTDDVVQYTDQGEYLPDPPGSAVQASPDEEHGPARKKARTLTVEEYEAMLDDETAFDNIDLP